MQSRNGAVTSRVLVGLTPLVLLSGLVIAVPAHAQSLGTFTWQLQPFCNVLTFSVTQNGGGVYTLDGYDNQCGAATRASAAGLAFLNPDGSVGLGVAIVVSPGGAPVHVDATINLATLNGTWRDSAGNTGSFAFNPGAASGSPRPAPSPVFPTGLSAGGAPVVNVGTPVSPTDAATKGYVDGADTADRAYANGLVAGAALPPASQFIFRADGGFAALGSFATGTLPASGASTRLLWHPKKAALRAGSVSGAQWNEGNIGPYSTAMGINTTASGEFSTAIGNTTTASGINSTAMGASTTASGVNSTAIGAVTTASGITSTAMGAFTTASGFASTAMGYSASAGFNGAFVYGDDSTNNIVAATSANQFTVRAAGGMRFFSTSSTVGAVPGVQLAPGASAWSTLSDARSKTAFRELDGEGVLARLAAMPIREWSYKAQDPGIRHVGPTAQDFHAAFELGEDPMRISTIDVDGIALRAIQALEARTEALRTENATLAARLAALEAQLAELMSREGQVR